MFLCLRSSQDGEPIVSSGVYIAAGDGPTEGLFKWFDGSVVSTEADWFRGKQTRDLLSNRKVVG